jgi:acetyltransferase-like isoleucine patch superfamily enzyme
VIPYWASAARLSIGKASRFRRFCLVTLDEAGCLTIGENTFFNSSCSINCLGAITIGSNTLFGEGVKLYDHNHIFNQANTLVENQGCKIGKIIIGDNCWIGSNCIILNNVTIGNNVVIGAGCVVAASIPDNTLVRNTQQLVTAPILFR